MLNKVSFYKPFQLQQKPAFGKIIIETEATQRSNDYTFITSHELLRNLCEIQNELKSQKDLQVSSVMAKKKIGLMSVLNFEPDNTALLYDNGKMSEKSKKAECLLMKNDSYNRKDVHQLIQSNDSNEKFLMINRDLGEHEDGVGRISIKEITHKLEIEAVRKNNSDEELEKQYKQERKLADELEKKLGIDCEVTVKSPYINVLSSLF